MGRDSPRLKLLWMIMNTHIFLIGILILTLGQVGHGAVHPGLSGDQMIYARVITAYQAGDLKQLNRSVQLLIKGFPQSVYADNALLFKAKLLNLKKNYSLSLKVLEKLLKNYPRGDKVPEALLVKAGIYKRLRVSRQAKRLWQQISQSYPGSIEASRAKNELRIYENQKISRNAK